jgi:long-chain acyl-CoA synthetase
MKHVSPHLTEYRCLGEALEDALERWQPLTALIEADRDRENCRLTYADFRRLALPIARALQDAELQAGDRAAIIMSNQSKWLIAAYAVFHVGGVLVPLDFKLSPAEHAALVAHAGVKAVFVEGPIWRNLAAHVDAQKVRVIVTEHSNPKQPPAGEWRWEELQSAEPPTFVPRERTDVACVVYSSGTGGRPKGCMLTHDNYLEQCRSILQLHPVGPGVRYLSILPTNHAIDFMVGFIASFVSGATVVHLRTLRPEFVREAFPRFRITHVSVVPMVLKALEARIKERFAGLSPFRGWVLRRLIGLNRLLTRRRPHVWLGRKLLKQVHQGFGGALEIIFTGGAFCEPSTLQFFYDLGIPIANGYGLTEAGTVLTLNDLRPFRADTVGKPVPGVELQIRNANADGVGEVAVRGRTIMAGYLDDPELTAETIVDGWLRTGDLGRVDCHGHVQLVGRVKNMIVTEGGKNIYPEDIEHAFEGLTVKEFCVFAVNYVWKQETMLGERLMLVLHPNPGVAGQGVDVPAELLDDVRARNRKLPDFKRISSLVVWNEDFPRTASLKIKRLELGERIARLNRAEVLRSL